MAIKTGNRFQMTLLPQTVDEFVAEEDPVRAYDEFINALDAEELGLRVEKNKVGNSSYDPISMLKLLVYGYSYGWRSSRKLERATHHNLSFIWLMGGLKPDHKTIANFRKNNKKALKRVLKLCARLCVKLEMIEGNCLFIDGSKIRGASSINQTKTRGGWEKELERIDKRVDDLLDECDQVDAVESDSLVRLKKELASKEKRKEKIKGLIERMDRDEREKINGSDPDSVSFKGRQGSHSGFNAQVSTDEKNGLVVNVDVVSESNDSAQFSNQVTQATDTLGAPPKTAVADAGYSNVDNLKEAVDNQIDVIVPSQKQSLRNPKENPFDKEAFQYDRERNRYICPEGKILEYSHYSATKNQYLYRFKGSVPCHRCVHFGVCTKGKRGRAITRLANQELKEALESRYKSEEGQTIYKKRKESVELVFGHIKRNLNGGAFLVRGIESVRAEFSIFGTCFNLARMITIAGGVKPLIEKIRATQPC